MGSDLREAMAWLDGHLNMETGTGGGRTVAAPTLDRMHRLVELLGDPQRQYPVVHITGTNGKTSTARLVSLLLAAKGLSVGMYTSPHLQQVNERITWNGDPIPDESLAEVLLVLAAIEPELDQRPSWFELTTAAAYRWFADVAVDVAVVEVGMAGTWDATNVADATVAMITNVELDHTEYLGPTREGIAREKSGIVKPGSLLILGERDPQLAPVFADAVARAGSTWVRDEDFGCATNEMSVGGRLLGLYTPGARYDDVFLPLHGAHQGDNAAGALAAVEAFFGQPLAAEVVTDAFAEARSPGRLEVVGRRPLCVLDGAHNPAGARVLLEAVDETFGGIERRLLVVGLMGNRDPAEMLEALDAGAASMVLACAPDTPRAVPADVVAAAAQTMGVEVEVVPSVAEAVERARAIASEDDLVLVTGSLYVVAEARSALVRG